MNKQANSRIISMSEFMACTQALIKLSSDDETTLCRVRQLFVTPTEKVGIKLLNAQKGDFNIRVKMTGIKK